MSLMHVIGTKHFLTFCWASLSLTARKTYQFHVAVASVVYISLILFRLCRLFVFCIQHTRVQHTWAISNVSHTYHDLLDSRTISSTDLIFGSMSSCIYYQEEGTTGLVLQQTETLPPPVGQGQIEQYLYGEYDDPSLWYLILKCDKTWRACIIRVQPWSA
jgi:hypothetical protein